MFQLLWLITAANLEGRRAHSPTLPLPEGGREQTGRFPVP